MLCVKVKRSFLCSLLQYFLNSGPTSNRSAVDFNIPDQFEERKSTSKTIVIETPNNYSIPVRAKYFIFKEILKSFENNIMYTHILFYHWSGKIAYNAFHYMRYML